MTKRVRKRGRSKLLPLNVTSIDAQGFDAEMREHRLLFAEVANEDLLQDKPPEGIPNPSPTRNAYRSGPAMKAGRLRIEIERASGVASRERRIERKKREQA